MDAVIAQRFSHLAETYHISPSAHVGDRKMWSTELAFYTVTRKLFEAWGHKIIQVASLPLLVSDAFDNVSHIPLIGDLRKRRADNTAVKRIVGLLSNRLISIAIDGF
jgi:hypothetical protein